MPNVAGLKGFSLPFRRGVGGIPAMVEGANVIAQNIRLLLTVRRGERLRRPDVGSVAPSFTFERNDELLPSLIRTEINSVLGRFERRAIVTRIDIDQEDSTQPTEDQKTHVITTVHFVVKASKQPGKVSLLYSRG